MVYDGCRRRRSEANSKVCAIYCDGFYDNNIIMHFLSLRCHHKTNNSFVEKKSSIRKTYIDLLCGLYGTSGRDR